MLLLERVPLRIRSFLHRFGRPDSLLHYQKSHQRVLCYRSRSSPFLRRPRPRSRSLRTLRSWQKSSSAPSLSRRRPSISSFSNSASFSSFCEQTSGSPALSLFLSRTTSEANLFGTSSSCLSSEKISTNSQSAFSGAASRCIPAKDLFQVDYSYFFAGQSLALSSGQPCEENLQVKIFTSETCLFE